MVKKKTVLEFLDSIDRDSSKIIIAGISGAGKSTIAKKIHQKLHLPYVPLDSLYHGENWIPKKDFRQQSLQFISAPSWVVDSTGYPETIEELWSAATHVIWLDLPLKTVLFRVLKRSIQRTITNEKLWNNNRETINKWFEKSHPLWTTIRKHAQRKIQIQKLIRTKRNEYILLHITQVKENNFLLQSLET